VLAGWLAFFLAPEGKVSQANFMRIQQGMTRGDVHAILGPPNVVETDFLSGHGNLAVWQAGTVVIDIEFDGNGKVVGKAMDYVLRDQIRRWLGL